VLLAEARWLYEDRRHRSEAIQSAATGLISSFATVMTLPPVVVTLAGQANWTVRGLMIATIATSVTGMVLAVVSAAKMKHVSKDLSRVQMVFADLLNSEIPCEPNRPEEVRRSLAKNLVVEPEKDGMPIFRSLSNTSDHQISWYQAARWALIASSILAGATLVALTITIH